MEGTDNTLQLGFKELAKLLGRRGNVLGYDGLFAGLQRRFELRAQRIDLQVSLK
jgi:hypothetical protein